MKPDTSGFIAQLISRFDHRRRSALETAGRRIRDYFLLEMKATFPRQGRAGFKWPARPSPNMIGIIDDFNHGHYPPHEDWFRDRPAGQGGRDDIRKTLVASSSWYSTRWAPGGTSELRVSFGSTAPFASRQQTGGPSRQPITVGAQGLLRRYLRDHPNMLPLARRRFGKAIHMGKEGYDWTIRSAARPFLIFTDSDADEVNRIFTEELARG